MVESKDMRGSTGGKPATRGGRGARDSMRREILFNDGWEFGGGESVRLPHTAVELPFSYFDDKAYHREFTYAKSFGYDPEWDGKDVFLRLDAAMSNTRVSLNGVGVAAHRDGYTPVLARLTDHLDKGGNRLEVVIDGSENPEIPPFGGEIDYLTYAGIYRDAWLVVRPKLAIGNVRIETPDPLAERKEVLATVFLADNGAGLSDAVLSARLVDRKGKVVAEQKSSKCGAENVLKFGGLAGISLWDIDDPVLYTLQLELDSPAGRDSLGERFGFRSAEFTTGGFMLNGRHLKIRGLNRHQSFPYVGYALGKAAQERDAEILKNELRLNLVRTSHYPQSKHFLNRCDELGLLVFEEIPGWQHIGGEVWKAEAVENVRRMIERDWNHPSIVIWGVRINESQDDHDFYMETNRLARELDPTRQTGGVRFTTHSELLEDVYTMNDFILGQPEPHRNAPRRGLRPQREVTGLADAVPYLVTEYNGHMYPTKSTDSEERLAEHALRHLEVIDASYGDPEISGTVGWCAWDYNTHHEFGSGDRICHHGVMDMFREPKFAAYSYASQGDPEGGVVLKPATYWARGERRIGGVFPLLVLTNCESVELRYGDGDGKMGYPDRTRFPHLPHPPVVFDRNHFSEGELGSWGKDWKGCVLRGLIGGKVVETVEFAASPQPTDLEVVPDAGTVDEFEAVRVMVRALDQCGNRIPFMPEPVEVSVEGPAVLLGPRILPLRAGATGMWVRSTGKGDIAITVTHDRFGTVSKTVKAG